jgi:hypothetical protein
MPDPGGGWHEALISDNPATPTSDRAFGYLFSAAFAVIGGIGLCQGRRGALWWIVVALAFLIGALFFAPLLGPLNRSWQKLALLLNKVIQPLVLSVMFFVVVTPLASLLRLFGRDPLQLRFEQKKSSYWIEYDTTKRISMKDTF